MMQINQNLMSGILPNDKKIELFSCDTTFKVFFIQNGRTKPFADLNTKAKENLLELMYADDVAMADLKDLNIDDALEQFAFHCFGASDNDTDVFEDGTWGNVEANTCDSSCMCSKWKSKRVEFNGQYLTARELQVIQFLATDYADKEIAHFLNISQSTLDTHKSNIMKKMNVHGKTGIITEAIKKHLIKL